MSLTYPKIYVDEAGNTGSNIQNQNQKYFVLSAVSFTDEELCQLKNAINYHQDSQELHFVNMKKSIKGRQVIKTLLQHPLMNTEHITYLFVDKDFCTYAKITDMLIEPVFYMMQANLYRKKGNIIIANCLQSFAEHHEYPEVITQFKTSFEKMIREQTPESIEDFYETVGILKIQTKEDGFESLLSLIEDSYFILKYILTKSSKYHLDTTLGSLLLLVNHWYKRFHQKLDIIIDNSKIVQHEKDLIKNLINIKEEITVGYDTRQRSYPIPIHTYTLVDSAENFGVQIADLVASAVAFRWNDAHKFKSFQDEIKDFPFFSLPCYPIMPATSEELSQPVDDSNDKEDPLEFLMRNLPF